MKPRIIHTRTFSCADAHPIVYYTFDKNNKAICEYCSAQFIYQLKDTIKPIDDDHVNKVLKGSG